jgi:hypothetical protein
MRIQILLFDGFDELDALGPLEVLHAAADAGAELRPELVRLGSATVTSGFGLQLHVSTPVEADAPPALLLLPGAGWLVDAEPGGWAEMQRDRIATVAPGRRFWRPPACCVADPRLPTAGRSTSSGRTEQRL